MNAKSPKQSLINFDSFQLENTNVLQVTGGRNKTIPNKSCISFEDMVLQLEDHLKGAELTTIISDIAAFRSDEQPSKRKKRRIVL